MKFKVIGTKTTLAPKDASVISAYIAQPEIYEPADAEAKAAAKAAEGKVDDSGDK